MKPVNKVIIDCEFIYRKQHTQVKPIQAIAPLSISYIVDECTQLMQKLKNNVSIETKQ